ncbi:hypothetical protein B0H11DRAFT_2185697 [Mycena galericulata]|nr:hypothetical protein B0H11DRAFT_2185697 [Mycena galericulata]
MAARFATFTHEAHHASLRRGVDLRRGIVATSDGHGPPNSPLISRHWIARRPKLKLVAQKETRGTESVITSLAPNPVDIGTSYIGRNAHFAWRAFGPLLVEQMVEKVIMSMVKMASLFSFATKLESVPKSWTHAPPLCRPSENRDEPRSAGPTADNPATPTTMAAMFLESHVLERKEWVKERKKLSTLLADSAVNAALNLRPRSNIDPVPLYPKRTIMDLQMELQRIRNNLDLRSGMEIVAEALRIRHNQTPAPMFRLASGVQPVLDAIANGLFDSPGGRVRYAVVQADVIAAVAAGGGVTTKNVHQALGKLYGKLSKQHHGGVSQQIQIREADQTMAEAVAAMSILLFARSLIGCRLDAVFTTAEGKSTVVSLILQSCNIYSFIP